MKKILLTGLAGLTLFLFSCKDKKKPENKGYISVTSLIEKQVAHVDTSLYSIVQVIEKDSLHKDTNYIPREKFRETAREFFELPDLTNPEVAERFKEDKMYDTIYRRVIISYTPVDPKKEEFKKIELLISQEIKEDGSNKVTNIIVDRVVNNRDGFLQKKMLWRTDRSFLIVTTTQLPGQAEITTTNRVTWNEENNP
jgi:PBP1b-binding outer membrane lipoprotein LpoB